MNKNKPTIEQYLELTPQLQHYYRTNYPELNYPTIKEYKDNKNKPTLEEFNKMVYYQKKKWRTLYPNEYPKAKQYNFK
jgi:hypothetical protein